MQLPEARGDHWLANKASWLVAVVIRHQDPRNKQLVALVEIGQSPPTFGSAHVPV
jgi:hypothetical protein